MRYAINNWVYPGESLRTSFARLARFGYDGIELKGELAEYPKEEVKALCQEFGLAVTSVLGWCIYPIPGRDLASTDPAERAAAQAYMRDVIDYAAEVAAGIVLTLPFPAGRLAPLSRPTDEAGFLEASRQEWALAVDSVRALAQHAAGRGITLAVEPINRFETYQINTLADGLRFIEDVGAPNVRLNLDTFHMNIDEPDPVGAIRKAGSLLAHMHVADSNHMPPGRGHVDFAAVMQALRAIGFSGAIVLEAVPPGSDAGLAVQMPGNLPLRDQYAEETIRYLKQLEAAVAV
jgi:sugar phosphate isomerase/epimerase